MIGRDRRRRRRDPRFAISANMLVPPAIPKSGDLESCREYSANLLHSEANYFARQELEISAPELSSINPAALVPRNLFSYARPGLIAAGENKSPWPDDQFWRALELRMRYARPSQFRVPMLGHPAQELRTRPL